MRGTRTRWLALGLLCLSLLCARQAAAHAFLIETDPQDSAALSVAPSEIRLRFNEPVTPVRVELRDQQGSVLSSASDCSAAGDTVRLCVAPPLNNGVYRAAYRVTSADGHAAAGHIEFGVGTEPPTAAVSGVASASATAVNTNASANAANTSVSWIALAVRTSHYFCVLAGLGGGFFLLLMVSDHGGSRSRVQRIVGKLAFAAAVSGVLLVGLNGAVLDGSGVEALASAHVWAVGMRTSTAIAAAVAVLGSLLTLAGLLLQSTRAPAPISASHSAPAPVGASHSAPAPVGASRGAAALLIGGLWLAALSLAVTGHVATVSPRWLSFSLILLHGVAASFWVGALLPLTIVLRRDVSPEALMLVRRFSSLALVGVSVLLATGIGMSLLQGVTSLAAIKQTDYGRTWLLKMAAVLALLGIAAWNRNVATPRLSDGAPSNFQALRRNVQFEVLVVVVILALTASFALTPPPRTTLQVKPAGVYAGPSTAGYVTVVSADQLTAVVEVIPARVGNNHIRVALSQRRDVQPRAVKLTSRWTHQGSEGATGSITAAHDAALAAALQLPAPGRWEVQLDLSEAVGISGGTATADVGASANANAGDSANAVDSATATAGPQAIRSLQLTIPIATGSPATNQLPVR